MENYKIVDAAISSRRALRGFSNREVSKEVVSEILKVAARAPSGNNTQPWQVVVLANQAKNKLTARINQELRFAEINGGVSEKSHPYEYDYYPSEWFEPFKTRRKKVGFALYEALGIEKNDIAARQKQFEENFNFFGAPIGLLFYMNRNLGKGSLIDMGMFIENICIAARGRGLDTCAQAVFSMMHQIIADEMKIPQELMLICGMSLGYAEENHPANKLITEREAVENFTQFVGFE